MSRTFTRISFACLSLALASSVLAAEGAYRDEALTRIDTLAEKFVGLAEAMPADSYTNRPMEGVRSVSEVFLHVAAVNFALSGVFGTPPPDGFNMRGYQESTTAKDEIVPKVRDSFAHFRAAIAKLGDGDADKATKMFRRDTTMRGAVWMALEHLSEHLGQSIAYARSNDVTPPWTAARGN